MVAYDDHGKGAALVLLHGFPFNRSMWREQINFLSAHGYRCVAPDLRGLGESSDKLQFVAESEGGETERQAEACRTINTMDDMARDVAALMDEVEMESAVICGLSMGCYVAFEFIHLFPARVRALVLAGGRAEGPDKAEKQSREQQARRVMEQGMDHAVDSILESLLSPRTLTDKPNVVARVREMVATTNPRGAAAAQRGMAKRRDYSDDLSQISVPTLIIAGREDGVRKPVDAELIHRGIKDSRVEIIKNAGHLMNMEQPEEFNQVMLDFLSDAVSEARP